MQKLIQATIVISCTVVAVSFGTNLELNFLKYLFEENTSFYTSILTGTIAYIFSSVFAEAFGKWYNDLIQQLNIDSVIFTAIGLLFGLFAGNLLLIPIWLLFTNIETKGEPWLDASLKSAMLFVPIIINVLSAATGIAIGLKYQQRIKKLKQSDLVLKNKVLDTSSIIDGRILDIYKTGFIEGELIIPKFVLDELQLIADSSDPIKRKRGRNGLDILFLLKKMNEKQILFTDKDYKAIKEVDQKLINFSKEENCKLITTDFNLSKVATLQGIEILNVNELTNAVKSVLIPGETISLKIIKSGKDPQQGIGYLEDGTMIIVEDGYYYMGKNIKAIVTSILQTSAGRLIFARHDLYKKDSSNKKS